MYLVLMILAVIVCVLLGAIVMIQNPKGGGLTSGFSSSSQLMGVQKTGDFLEKGTWILAITLMILSMAINVSVKSGGTTASPYDGVQKTSQPAAQPAKTPATTTPLNVPQQNSNKK
ncbi:MAG TPA: preprotein translocase subunit SecG [Mucilaginibacter sp.]|nr:preprotein translocase subunit SecG [Mucilaginibacter sp.]